jgi:hypothetical protein
MPRYFFNMHGTCSSTDSTGEELRDNEAAILLAPLRNSRELGMEKHQPRHAKKQYR